MKQTTTIKQLKIRTEDGGLIEMKDASVPDVTAFAIYCLAQGFGDGTAPRRKTKAVLIFDKAAAVFFRAARDYHEKVG